LKKQIKNITENNSDLYKRLTSEKYSQSYTCVLPKCYWPVQHDTIGDNIFTLSAIYLLFLIYTKGSTPLLSAQLFPLPKLSQKHPNEMSQTVS